MSFTSFLRRGICFLALTVVGTVWGTPALPNIDTNNVFNVTNAPYNAVGDGTTDNTAALQAAINAAGAAGSGGTVLISGTNNIFMTGPLTLKSKVNVQIDGGTLLRMLPVSTWTNLPAQNDVYGNLFYANGLSDVQISGAGAIDGQGSAWWSLPGTSHVFTNRPYAIWFNGGCHRVLLEDFTISNTPAQFIVFKGSDGDITIQGITESAPPSTGVANPSHNTDGLDLVGTNILAQNCNISVGDDNFALGSSGGPTSGVLITNCLMGTGHGLSIGSSLTANLVSNVTVINCNYDGTDNGIRFKASRTSGGDVHDFYFYNLGMTNVQIPLTIYSYYSSSVKSVSPETAGADPAQTVTTKTPKWRNIVVSNVTATTQSGFPASIIWGLPEMCVSNVTIQNMQVTASKGFNLYNVRGFKIIDSQITVAAVTNTYVLYNAQAVFTNSVPGAANARFDGLVTNGIGNDISLYNAPASLKKSNILAGTTLTLGGSTLTVTNNLDTSLSPPINFILGTNAATVRVISNLTASGTINTSAGDGFTNGTYTLFTYGTGLTWGSPTLGTTPPGYLYALDTNTVGQVNLVVTQPIAPVITNSPMSQTVVVGSNVTFSVVAGGTAPLSYQWWLNPTPTSITDATNATLTLPNVQLTDAGDYFVIVTNNYGSAMSMVATLTVLTPFQQWQITYFGSTNNSNAAPEVDADTDGMSNDAEFQAGTIPTNSASVLKITSVVVQQGTNLVLTWSTAGPRTNLIQSAGVLTNGSFTDLSGPLAIPQVGDVVTNIILSGGVTNPLQFYRVRLGP